MGVIRFYIKHCIAKRETFFFAKAAVRFPPQTRCCEQGLRSFRKTAVILILKPGTGIGIALKDVPRAVHKGFLVC